MNLSRKNGLTFLLLLAGLLVNAREYHVAKNGNDNSLGTAEQPLKTINAAAQKAYPGDTITVYGGTYREWINPPRGGESNSKRILYRAAEGDQVFVKGSEEIKEWKKQKNGIWKMTLSNTAFGDLNPLDTYVEGDWFNDHGRKHHTSDLYLNGQSLFEVDSLHKVEKPQLYNRAIYPEQSLYTWYVEQDENGSVLYANFGTENPNKNLIELSVRPTCFYPTTQNINYLTIRGFDFSQAATQWGAPTAHQVGMIATHWNKGWIIENNTIHDTKSSGITLGKDHASGHDVWSNNKKKDGSLHYIEVTFNVLRNKWNKEHIGSHIVRNNTIYNCEQTGMCGSMGCAFSEIYDNHIYDIYVKRQFSGAEIGGIKFHAPIDTKLYNNHIHQAYRGIWLDWMTQGTRVSSNLLYDNDSEDLFIEVDHGPYLVDNNFMLSPKSIRNQSQGGAYIHNFIAGDVMVWPEFSRYTPYHLPHSTMVKGLSVIRIGDDRYINNIFLPMEHNDKHHYGLSLYDKSQQKVQMENNIYYNHATPSKHDVNGITGNKNASFKLVKENKGVFLELNNLDVSNLPKTKLINTESLGKTLVSEAYFENPDGTSLVVDFDFLGNKRSVNPQYGPLELPLNQMKRIQLK